ncbi:hypothetical protein R3X25_07775 [Lutibacter sp. TH_r2]|uniref:hypothetical protein n=1 Tax=Lutibacter sp. TH_r2 TaxID=3082083 RepID=UPI002953A7D4|nr:hypothetical protein [Lutibacter sp. TH_r2]MDV7187178.1 hypothetical protein [Lutibacter sp. TH_r2]
MRLVTTFFEALSNLENGLDNGNKNMQLHISDTYNLLGNTQGYFLTSDFEEVYNFFKQKDGDYLKRVEMLASLIYLDSKEQNSKVILGRSINLMNHYLENTKEFSFELQEKFKQMKLEFEKFEH